MLIVFGISYSFVDKVKMKIRMQCHPLLEDQFRPIISKNYYEARLFWFELDQKQTKRLIALFSSQPILETISPSLSVSSFSKALQTINVKDDSNNREVFSSNINVACLDSKKKWSSLFKVSLTDEREDGEDFEKSTSEFKVSHSNHSSYDWEEPSCISHSSEEEIKSCEAPNNGSGSHTENEESAFFESGNEIYSSYYSDVKDEGEEYKSTDLEVNLPCLNLKDVAENMEGNALFKSDEENLLDDNHEEDIQMHSMSKTENNSLGVNTDVDLNSDCQLVAQVLHHSFGTSLFWSSLYAPVYVFLAMMYSFWFSIRQKSC